MEIIVSNILEIETFFVNCVVLKESKGDIWPECKERWWSKSQSIVRDNKRPFYIPKTTMNNVKR